MRDVMAKCHPNKPGEDIITADTAEPQKWSVKRQTKIAETSLNVKHKIE